MKQHGYDDREKSTAQQQAKSKEAKLTAGKTRAKPTAGKTRAKPTAGKTRAKPTAGKTRASKIGRKMEKTQSLTQVKESVAKSKAETMPKSETKATTSRRHNQHRHPNLLLGRRTGR